MVMAKAIVNARYKTKTLVLISVQNQRQTITEWCLEISQASPNVTGELTGTVKLVTCILEASDSLGTNVLNKLLRTADKGWSCSLGFWAKC